MAASVADLREFLLQRGFSEADADFIAALADDLRDGAAEQVLERVEQRVGHFEAIFKERLNGHETANRHEFREVLSTIREVVANAQTENEKRFSEINTANEKRFSELKGEVAGIKGQIDGIKGEVAGIKGQIDGLQGQIDGLRGEMAGLKNSMDAMRGELRGWVAQIGFRVVVIQAGLIGLIFAILGALGVFS